MPQPPTRPVHRPLAVALLAVVTLFLSACGGSQAGGGAGALRVGVSSAMNTLDPLPYGIATFPLYGTVFDQPVGMQDGAPTPALVESWEQSADGLRLTLKVRQGVRYSDGTPFDAAALAWVLNWAKDPSKGLRGQQFWQTVTVSVVDPTTVRLSYPRPLPAIFGMLALVPIVKPNAADSGVGTGPFTIASFAPGTSISMVRNPNYWSPGTPTVKSLDFTNYPEASSAALALRSGTIGMFANVPPSQVNSLKSAGSEIATMGQNGFLAILVGSDTPPMTDARVRRALSLAFNREAFVKTGLFDTADPLYTIFGPGWPHYDPAVDAGTFDLQQARLLLQEAGVESLDLTIASPNTLPQQDYLPIYQQDLASIGVNLSINQVDNATWAKVAAEGTYQLLANSFSPLDFDPATLLGAAGLRPVRNSERFSAPEYTELVQRAGEETDPTKRTDTYKVIGRYIQEQSFIIPLATNPTIVAHSSSVGGVEPGFSGMPRWSALTTGSGQ